MEKKIPHEVDVIIGRNLRKYRINANMSQQKIANYLDITYQQVQKFETATNRVSARFLFELSALFNVEMHEFFNSEENNETK